MTVIYHNGKLKAQNADITGVINATDGKFNGSLSFGFKALPEQQNIYLSFDTGFNFSGQTSYVVGSSSFTQHNIYLPTDLKYNGVQCIIENTATYGIQNVNGTRHAPRSFKIRPNNNQSFLTNVQGFYEREITDIILHGRGRVILQATVVDGALRWFVSNASDFCYNESTKTLNRQMGLANVRFSYYGYFRTTGWGGLFDYTNASGNNNGLIWDQLKGAGNHKFTWRTARTHSNYFPIVVCTGHGYGWVSEKTAQYFVVQTADDSSNNNLDFELLILELG